MAVTALNMREEKHPANMMNEQWRAVEAFQRSKTRSHENNQ